MIVYNNKQQDSQGITTSDIEVNNKLAHTYIEIIKSKNILDKVKNDLNLKQTYNELYKSISIKNIDETGIINISVTNKNAKVAYDIAQKIPSLLHNEIKEIMGVENTSVLEVPVIAKEPVFPNKILSLFLAFIMGIILGLLVIFTEECLDKKIKFKKGIRYINKIDVIGTIPYSKTIIDKNIENNDTDKFCFGMKEFLCKDIIQNIEFSNVDRNINTILFSSYNKGEGKSIIVSKLATYLTSLGKKILIIDFNLISPMINNILEVENCDISLGSNPDNIEFINCINKTGIKNLDVFSIGKTPSKTSDLLNSETIRYFVSDIKNSNYYDYIFIDTPSLSISSDLDIIVPYADEAIIVLEDKKTKVSEIAELKDVLHKNNVKILGSIFNKINVNKLGEY